MRIAITLFTLSTVIVFLFSCRNKTYQTDNSKVKHPEQAISPGGDSTNSNDLEILEQSPQIVEDIDGNIYRTVKIGNQTWMAKNLKTTRYNDGTAIPLVTDGNAWAELTKPGYCWYDNDSVSFKPSYGALYNGYAVMTGKLCPTDWHVPDDEEWATLTNYLGGDRAAGFGLKETGTDYWVSPNTGATNESGFTALPGGFRYYDGLFYDFGFSGYWWTSTEYSSTRAIFRYMDYQYSNVFRFDNLKKNGFSVRCIRDY